MALADFDSYREAAKASALYSDPMKFAKCPLSILQKRVFFSADRAIREYAHNIWHLD